MLNEGEAAHVNRFRIVLGKVRAQIVIRDRARQRVRERMREHAAV